MKRILASGLVALLALPVLSTATAFAHNGVDDVAQTSTTSSPPSQGTGSGSSGNTSSSTSGHNETEPAEDAKSIADRIAQRKTELKTKLTALEKTRIQTKCKASQGNLSSEKGRIKGLETSRSEVYTNLLNRLNSLSEKLKVKGVDTTTLNSDIATLKTKIDTFNTDLTAYKTAVTDLSGMDCAADPDGFKASLEAARSALKKVNDDGAAVRSYLSDTIKPLLKSIRTELEKSESANQTESNTPSTGNTGTTNTTTTTGGN